MEMSQKMFNCGACGPIEVCYIIGDWVNKEYADLVFEMTRPDYNVFSAKLSEERSAIKPDRMKLPKILAEVENYAEEFHKFQCPQCGRAFVIPKKVQADPGSVSGGPATLSSGNQNQPNQFGNAFGPFGQAPSTPQILPTGIGRSALEAMFDSAFSESQIDDILIELGDDPINFSAKVDKVEAIVDRLY